MRTSKRFIGAAAVCALTFALAMGLTSNASAAPPDPTLGLASVYAVLAAAPNHTIGGYFLTVDDGSQIDTITVNITAVTGGPAAKDALIMFDATGPQIDQFGGIVAGMSGSPIYVDDRGTEKIIGAVSYGDYFTKGGMGLATPIEAMDSIKSAAVPVSTSLDTPLVTSRGVITRVIVAPDPQDYAAAAKQGAFVARPLSSVFIGGLDPNSLGYKLLDKVLTGRGQSVVALAAPLSGQSAVGDQTFNTPLVPGASVAAMESRGDMWIGAVGTVTNVDTDSVLAFGHPAMFTGPSSLYMMNAYIDGVWPSLYEPYKVARPGALQGTITQDRSHGILGMLGQFPAETTITAEAFDVDTGDSTSSVVYMPRQLIDNGTVDAITGAMAPYVAGENLMDAQQTPGSAEITTTLVASDGTATYTVSLPTVVDDGYDIPLAAMQDAATALETLQQVPDDGIHTWDLLSLDVNARYTTRRNWAEIVGVALPNGLKIGANRVEVSALVYGVEDTQTIDATITIPAGTQFGGTIVALSESALAQNTDGSYESIGVSTDEFGEGGVMINLPDAPTRTSLANAVKLLNTTPPNNVLTVAYTPNNPDESDFIDFPDDTGLSSSSILATAGASWDFNSEAEISVTQLSAKASPKTVGYNGFSLLSGTLIGPSAGATVAVYATPAGGTEHFIETVPTDEGDDGLEFEEPVGPLTTRTTFRIHYDGVGDNSSADTTVVVNVGAHVVLHPSATSAKTGHAITLKATVSPVATAGGSVVFEYNDHGSHWRAIATKTLVAGTSSSTSSVSWKVVKGAHKVRARFLGGTSNAASTSAAVTVKGK
jgi:hypothetical protein